MPAVPLVQINEFAGFLQDLFFAGVEIALEKILLKEVFLFDLAAFFFLRLLISLSARSNTLWKSSGFTGLRMYSVTP